jgi:hypothetical protein
VKKYLIALPVFPNSKGFNHQTILVSANNKFESIKIVNHLKPNKFIGDIKEVNY